jgi:uncharacterized protein involved in exopolysaccharide biosynthesis
MTLIPQWVHRFLRPFPADAREGILTALRVAPFVAVFGAAYSLLITPTYISTAAFIAETPSTRGLSGSLGALADQFGFGMSLGSGPSPAYFADLLTTRSILEPLLALPMQMQKDSTTKPLLVLLKAKGKTPSLKQEAGVKRLRRAVRITPDVKTNVITIAVSSRDPLLSFEIAKALLASLDQFNMSVRQSRARNERQFLEGRVTDIQDQLRQAEDSMQQFMSANRGDTRGIPTLAFREARLRRNLEMMQTRFVELQRQLDQARVQEVRDTPAITVLDQPNVPARRAKPYRKLVTLVVTVLGMSLAYGYSRLRSAYRTAVAISDASQTRDSRALAGRPA